MKPTLLVLAAGMGSRYGGLKQLDGIGPNGETIIDYSIYDAIQGGFGKVVFIIRKDIEADFKEIFVKRWESKIEIDYVFQELHNIPEGYEMNPERVKPWGTGHAVLVAAEAVKEPFAVINADDFYGREAFATMGKFLINIPADNEAYSMVGYELKNTLSEHGYVSRGVCQVNGNSYLENVVERTHIERKGEQIIFTDENEKEQVLTGDEYVSMNFWGFAPSFFTYLKESFQNFIKANYDQLKAEFYIPTVVNELRQSNVRQTQVLPCDAKWFGVTYQEDRPLVVAKVQQLVDEGKYPSQLW